MNEREYIEYLVTSEVMEIWTDNLSEEARKEYGLD